MGQGTDMSGTQAQLALDPGDQLTALRFGQRVGEAIQRWGKK